MTSRAALVMLPCGLWRDGAHHRDALVHAVSGSDEMLLFDVLHGGVAASSASRVTSLLAHCVESVGPIVGEPIESTVRSLTIGDREALLLHVRRLTFGDRIETVLPCPVCRAPLESELSVDALLLPPNELPVPEWHECEIRDDDGLRYAVRFRLPTGADQEAVARVAVRDPDAACAALLARCIGDLRYAGDTQSLDASSLPANAQRYLGELMAELDPQAELTLDLACAVCGEAFEACFDAARYLMEELQSRGAALLQEVHTLALHYHWSESDILALTPARRTQYLELIAESAAVEAGA